MQMRKEDRAKYILALKTDTAKETEKNMAALMLGYDHFKKTRLQLRHIADYPLLDALLRDSDSDNKLTLKEYLQLYDQETLSILLDTIKDARNGLDYLEKLIKEEQDNRKSDKVIDFNRARGNR